MAGDELSLVPASEPYGSDTFSQAAIQTLPLVNIMSSVPA